MWRNTKAFSPVATGKEKCDAHGLSQEMREWVFIQVERFKNGFIVDGQRITGAHYFFLNFFMLIDKKTSKYRYPTFLDFQADFFLEIERARTEHKGIVCVKRRQIGFSELMAAIAVLELWFKESPQIVLATDGAEQLKPLWEKIEQGINTLNKGIFAKNLRVNTKERKQMGYQKKGSSVWLGNSGEINRVNYTKGNIGDGVGKSPSLLICDEAGKAEGLVDFYSIMRPAITDNLSNTMTGLPIILGATVDMTKSADLREMFYNPEAYNMLSYEFDGLTKPIGYFVEGWKMRVIDAEGNSLKEPALKLIHAEREKIQNGTKDERALVKEISQYPLSPAEAFLDNGVNIFNGYKLKVQIDALMMSEITLRTGDIEFMDNTWQFIQNKNGRFTIYEDPEYILDEKGNMAIPEGMYIGGADPIHQELGTSQGAIYIHKLYNDKAKTTCDLPVAEYLFRPTNPAVFADDCLKLSYYYNATMMVEPTTYIVKDYFNSKNQMGRLANVPRVVTTDISKGSQTKYGCPVNASTKPYVIGLVAKYIDENVEKIVFPRLLDEMIRYTSDGNFDLIMAFAQALAYRADLWDWKPKTQREQITEFNRFIRTRDGRIIREAVSKAVSPTSELYG